MKQLKYILIVISSAIILGSCSFLTKVSSLEIKKSERWIEGNICQSCESFGGYMMYDYKYKTITNDSLLISVCPRLYYYSLSAGPPLIPLIPNPFLLFPKKWSLFDIDIKFQNFKGKVIDITYLQYGVKKSKTRIIPTKIELLTYNGKGVDTTEIKEQKFQVSSDTLELHILFNISQNKIKRFSINFDHFTVNDSIVYFPTLNLKRKGRFLYDPLVIGH
jgi:hypothetical protein